MHRPSKAWWARCTRAVTKSGGARDVKKVCGATWQKLSRAARIRIVKVEKGR